MNPITTELIQKKIMRIDESSENDPRQNGDLGMLPAKWIDSRETPTNRDNGRLEEETPKRQGQPGRGLWFSCSLPEGGVAGESERAAHEADAGGGEERLPHPQHQAAPRTRPPQQPDHRLLPSTHRPLAPADHSRRSSAAAAIDHARSNPVGQELGGSLRVLRKNWGLEEAAKGILTVIDKYSPRTVARIWVSRRRRRGF